MEHHEFSTTKHKARKQHRCIWCGEAIVIGEKYVLHKIKFDGVFQSNKYHAECWGSMLCSDFDPDVGYAAFSMKRGKPEEK